MLDEVYLKSRSDICKTSPFYTRKQTSYSCGTFGYITECIGREGTASRTERYHLPTVSPSCYSRSNPKGTCSSRLLNLIAMALASNLIAMASTTPLLPSKFHLLWQQRSRHPRCHRNLHHPTPFPPGCGSAHGTVIH